MTDTQSRDTIVASKRALKMLRIVQVLDEAFRDAGIDPHSLEAARGVVWLEPEEFAKAALVAGVRPPSEITRKAIIELYIQRSKSSAA
jgi:hypothetical protein